MKTIFTFLAFITLLVFPTQAQWKQCNGPYGANVYAFGSLGTTLYAGTEGRVFRSENYGMDWVEDNAGMPYNSVTHFVTIDSLLFAGGHNGLYRKSKNDKSWTKLNVSNIIIDTNSVRDVVSSMVANQSTLLVGISRSVYRSEDNGNTWVQTNFNFAFGTVTSLKVIGEFVYAGCEYGSIFKSKDNFETVSVGMNNSNRFQINDFAEIDSTIFAVSDAGRILRSEDNGATALEISSGPPWLGPIYSLLVIENTLLAATARGIFRSNDKAKSWQQSDSGTVEALGFKVVRSLFKMGTMLFAGNSPQGVFLSTDNGVHWTEMNNGLTDQNINDIAVIGNSLFTVSEGRECVFLSDDGGDNWLTIPLVNKSVTKFAVIDSTLFAGTYEYDKNRNLTGGVVRSSDLGKTWVASSIFTKSEITALEVSGTTLFAVTKNNGAYRSNDFGASWVSLNLGVPNETIKQIIVLGPKLFAIGTAGVYNSIDSGESWVNAKWKYRDYYGIYGAIGTTILAGAGGYENRGAEYSDDEGKTWKSVAREYLYFISFTKQEETMYAASSYTIKTGPNSMGYTKVYRCSDYGKNWTTIITDSVKLCNTIKITGSTFFAGTRMGLLKYDLSTVSTNDRQNDAPTLPHLVCYPNPVGNTVTIDRLSRSFSASTSIKYTITTLSGQAIMDFVQNDEHFSIPTDTLGNGVYFMTAQQGTARSTTVFTVMK